MIRGALFLLTLLLPYSVLGIVETPPPAAVQPSGVMDIGSAVQLVLGLFLVLLMIVASAWLVKRLSRWQGGHTDQLKVVGGLAIGARERIVLLQVGEQQLLVGITPGNIRTLHVLEEPLPVSDGKGTSEPLAAKFATILNKQRSS